MVEKVGKAGLEVGRKKQAQRSLVGSIIINRLACQSCFSSLTSASYFNKDWGKRDCWVWFRVVPRAGTVWAVSAP